MRNLFIFSFLLAFAVSSFGQARAGSWYLLDEKSLWEVVLKNDTLVMYPKVPFDLKVNEPRLIGTIVALTLKNTTGNTSTYRFTAVHNKNETGQISFTRNSSSKNERLLFTALPDRGNEKIITPIKLISADEINSYSALKDISEMTDDDFIVYAQKVDSLVTDYKKNRETMSKEYLHTELKLIIAGLGYNPLLNMQELNEKLTKFKTRPATAQIAKSYRH
jgi:hypothetical protein